MKSLANKTLVVLLAVALAAAPALGNPTVPGPVVYAPIVIAAAFGGAIGGAVIWALHRNHARNAVRFEAEEVAVNVTEGRAAVTGRYTFYNPGAKPKTLKLRFPFARADVGEPENVVVRDGGTGADLPFTWKGRDCAFPLAVPAQGTAELVVSYEQTCRAKSFTYILTSARSWRRPIKVARLVVTFAPPLTLAGASYPLVKDTGRDGIVRYRLVRDDFFPDVDLTIRWK